MLQRIKRGLSSRDNCKHSLWLMDNKAGVAFGLATISVVFAAVVFVAENARDGRPMQFIERHLGFSPDGGDGSMEVLVAIVLVAIISLGALRLATIK
jgi:hypothetical protein